MSEIRFSVLDQLDQLEEIMLEGSRIPFSGGRLVNEQDAVELLDAVREAMPSWSIGGTLTIIIAVWYSVQLDVQINEWFGRFYDALQLALSKPGALTIEEFNGYMFECFSIAGIYIVVNVIFNGFLVNPKPKLFQQLLKER